MKMKKIGIGVITCLCVATSCDVVNDYTSPYTPPIEEERRAVLLEEYTGMLCVNCPAAAEEARMLKETFGDKLIVVSVHAGGFSTPSGIFRTDLRSEAGEAYFKSFGFSAIPIGMVNRSAQKGTVALNPSSWAEAISREMAVKSPTELALTLNYDAVSRNYTCHLAASGLQDPSSAIILWLIEDGIVTPQVIPEGTDMKYVQRHVLRGALNGTWGENITPDDRGEWQTERTYTLPAKYVVERCSIVAFISSDSHQVISVIEKPLL